MSRDFYPGVAGALVDMECDECGASVVLYEESGHATGECPACGTEQDRNLREEAQDRADDLAIDYAREDR